jgi:hypothetical protein
MDSEMVSDLWFVYGPNGKPVVTHAVAWIDATRLLTESAGRNHAVHSALGLPVSLALLRMLPGRPVALQHPKCACGSTMTLKAKGHACHWACPNYVSLGCRTRQFNPDADLVCQ